MCAMCRRAFPEDYVDHPSLLRPIESTPDTGFEDGQQWFYEGRNGASKNVLFVWTLHKSFSGRLGQLSLLALKNLYSLIELRIFVTFRVW